jgi:formate hydrogenlyase subunit 3/multisubunit Na+/H+ antiporter MnhD subunit
MFGLLIIVLLFAAAWLLARERLGFLQGARLERPPSRRRRPHAGRKAAAPLTGASFVLILVGFAIQRIRPKRRFKPVFEPNPTGKPRVLFTVSNDGAGSSDVCV